MHKILILGPQGSGKGTQANILGKKLHVPALSMGQLLRDEIKSGSTVGKEIDQQIHVRGELVPDEVALGILANRLKKDDAQHGYIIDGYPRNRAQFDAYTKFDTPTHVVLIDVPHDVSIKRLMKRAEIEKRPDDTPELIQHRLDIYDHETKPIIDLYIEAGLLRRVDGVGEIEEVAKRIAEVMELEIHLHESHEE